MLKPGFVLHSLLFLFLLVLANCRDGYDTVSCQKGCTHDYNVCLTTAFLYGRTPAQETAPGLLLILGCASDHSACNNSCTGFQSRE